MLTAEALKKHIKSLELIVVCLGVRFNLCAHSKPGNDDIYLLLLPQRKDKKNQTQKRHKKNTTRPMGLEPTTFGDSHENRKPTRYHCAKAPESRGI